MSYVKLNRYIEKFDKNLNSGVKSLSLSVPSEGQRILTGGRPVMVKARAM